VASGFQTFQALRIDCLLQHVQEKSTRYGTMLAPPFYVPEVLGVRGEDVVACAPWLSLFRMIPDSVR
jgi:hypothetical protein